MSTISASTTTTTAYKVTADTTGTLVLQTGATPTTALTIDSSQNVTFAKGFTVGATAAPAFSAYLNSQQSVTSNTFTKVQCNIEEFDTNSNYDNATNYRFTPTVAGYYQINGSVAGAGTAVTRLITILYKNGVSYKTGNDISGAPNKCGVSSIVYLNGSTDYVELYCYITGTSPVAFGESGNPTNTWFNGAMVRSA